MTSAMRAELALERRRDAGRHRLRAGARQRAPGPRWSGSRPAAAARPAAGRRRRTPASATPSVSSVVATGRRMNGAERFMRPASPRRRRRAPAPPAPSARRQPVEGEVDHRRGEQRQHLADDQAADDGDAERMAQLGAGAGAEHQRQRAEERRHRRHQDRPEAQQARLVDRLARRACPRCARRRARSRSS